MAQMQERNFHLLMTGLLLTALFVDPAMESILEQWSPPKLGSLPIVVGFVWLARYSVWKAHCAERDNRRLREQIVQLELRVAERIEAVERQISDRRMRRGGSEER